MKKELEWENDYFGIYLSCDNCDNNMINVTGIDWKDFKDYSNSKSLTLDDIYFLKNRNNRDKQVASNTRQEMKNQMERVRAKPQSVASTGSQGTPKKSLDDNIFDSILGIDKELDSMFT